MKQKSIKIIVSILLSAVLFVSIFIVLIYNGVLLLNNPSEKQYPVKGVDVSSYQGEIDWEVLANENIQFAFIKATEGSTYVDPNFSANYNAAIKTQLRIGAYHFFSYDSSGKTQAENFISVVPKTEGMLPPVADVEFYGNKETILPNKDDVYRELSIFLLELEKHYGMKPIIYATEKSYRLYIENNFSQYDLWIRNVISKPTISETNPWIFWQYTNRETLNGYAGEERFIDMNVFNGSKEEFLQYGK